jgi:HSP20 family protein
MSERKETGLAPARVAPNPFRMLSDITSHMDRMFDDPFGSHFSTFFSPSRLAPLPAAATWAPQIDVFERDKRLVTKVDLPGMKKGDVKVEVTDGHLAISGERKSESEETKDNVYRCERSYGSFYRAVPLPEGVKLDDVKAIFSEGVLEVSVPLPAQPGAKVRKVEIEDAKEPRVAA